MTDLEASKDYLEKGVSGNLYEHLKSVISNLLDERPEDPVDAFEELSRSIKTNPEGAPRVPDADSLESQKLLGLTQIELMRPLPDGEDDDDQEEDGENTGKLANMIEQMRYFEDAGVGLGREESMRVFLALKQLGKEQPLKKIRFWGKVYTVGKGLGDYYVAECEYTDEEAPVEEDPIPDAPPDEGEGEDDDKEQLPVSKFEWPKVMQKEKYPEGPNKYRYFVCTELKGTKEVQGRTWIPLKDVTPAQVACARQIKKLFTGDPDALIKSYPPFPSCELKYKGENVDFEATYMDWQQNPGTEAQLLRAQIADITADCSISPKGWWVPEEEEPEEGEEMINIRENEHGAGGEDDEDGQYQGHKRSALLIPDEGAQHWGPEQGWTHHQRNILPQGKCTWEDPRFKDPDAEEEEEEDEDGEPKDDLEKETGRGVLDSIALDEPVYGMPAWTSKVTSQRNLRYAGVVLSSNKWPGAHALAYSKGKKFQNVYFGYGHKYSQTPFTPQQPPEACEEYPNDLTITEESDPTRAEELEHEAAQKAKDGEGGDDDDDGDDD